MFAEIISNGDEITSGKILDTNTQWLCNELANLGIAAPYHTAVGDDLDAMTNVLRIAINRADLIIWTGGLGPTADDLTRQAFANAANVSLVHDETSLQYLQEICRRRGYAMPPDNDPQTFLPQGALPIRNPHGAAPGIDFTIKRKSDNQCSDNRLDAVRMIAYPGVPAEMKEMWDDTGRKMIQTMLDTNRGEKRVIKSRSIHSFGLGESQAANMLPEILDRNHIPKVGITATLGTITLRIAAEAETETLCDQQIEPVAKIIYEALGNHIFGEDTDTLPAVVCRLVNAQHKKLAVVEAGTRGLLAESLAATKESSECFLGGVVVPPKQPISPERMIEIGRKMFDADYLLLIGAYPPGEPDRSRSGETFVAVVNAAPNNASNNTKESPLQTAMLQMYPYVGHPYLIDDLHIKRALDMFRIHAAPE